MHHWRSPSQLPPPPPHSVRGPPATPVCGPPATPPAPSSVRRRRPRTVRGPPPVRGSRSALVLDAEGITVLHRQRCCRTSWFRREGICAQGFFDPTISVESSGGRLRYGQFSGLGYDPLRIILYIYCLLSIWPFWRRRQCWCAWGVLGGSYAYLNLSVRLFILLLHRRSYSTRFRRSGKPGRYVLATPNMLIWQLSLHCYDFFLSV
jgi:hypothetical protein